MRIAGSLPRFPQRLMVKGETLKISATSETVNKSGRLSKESLFLGVGLGVGDSDILPPSILLSKYLFVYQI